MHRDATVRRHVATIDSKSEFDALHHALVDHPSSNARDFDVARV